jgi:hypothetical protein
MTSKTILEGKVQHYERLLRQMQGHTFYVEDPDGLLRRWYPPAPLMPKEGEE